MRYIGVILSIKIHSFYEQLVNNINNELIRSRNAIDKNEIPGTENSNKIVDIVEKFLDFNKKQKDCPSDLARVTKVFDRTHIKELTSKEILQRLPIALTEVKVGTPLKIY